LIFDNAVIRSGVAMQVDLEAEEIESLIEALECLKIKISYVKGATYTEKTEKLVNAEALELKLRTGLPDG
jgi:hypothetical protein